MSEESLASEGIELEEQGEGGHRMFDEGYYARTGWNLNLLPHSKGSIIRHMKASINGINVPWLYVGMQFATFCWHTEVKCWTRGDFSCNDDRFRLCGAQDNYLYSINYSHLGDNKQWYGVPSGEW
jgi:[histone H3]-trimethyl-L-lysine4 demethylase